MDSKDALFAYVYAINKFPRSIKKAKIGYYKADLHNTMYTGEPAIITWEESYVTNLQYSDFCPV